MELDCREIERLKELVPYEVLTPTPDEIIKEIERLNNIIDELEKYLKNRDNFLENRLTMNKLKELKEGK